MEKIYTIKPNPLSSQKWINKNKKENQSMTNFDEKNDNIDTCG